MINTSSLSTSEIQEIVKTLQGVLENREKEKALRERIEQAKKDYVETKEQLQEISGEKQIFDPVMAGETIEESGATYIEWKAKEWGQPVDGAPGWAKGEYVRYMGGFYLSLVDDNRYSPSAYPQGWKKVKP